jgi:hypothetical protein
MEGAPRRRRIDRVTADDFLDGVDERSTDELRGMRDECRQEEARLSYARRLVQGRIDIARAEAARRERGDAEPLDLVALLPTILADEPPSQQREARAVSLYTPEGPLGQRAHDALLDDPALGRLPDLRDAEVDELLERLRAQERDVSATRRRVLDHYDRLQAELIRRYRDGGAGDAIAAVVGQPAAGASQPASGASQPAAGASQPAAGASQPAAGATDPGADPASDR